MSAEKPAVQDFYHGDNWSAEESIGYLLRTTVSTLMRAAETAMRPHGLTSVQWAPLMIISRGGNPTAASLARDLNTDTGAMTRMLDRLEAKGLLMRSRSATDRRVVELTLTEQGRELTTLIPHHLAKVYNSHLSGFSHDEFNTLKNMLRRIIANRDTSV
jgi:DNA-binding MarR family transcriptional regulator